jgi:rSAM/selenodomain-associated transferase 1
LPKLELVNKTNCILFFVKFPGVGKVKTRLAKAVGSAAASRLYEHFTTDMLDILGGINADIVICFDSSEDKKKYCQWIGENFRYIAQDGKDIGERMHNALHRAFLDGYCRAIVIGSDIPDLPPDYINRAFIALGENNAVIGPSSDGGYYLIGFNADSLYKQVFEGINWSSGQEFDETMKAFNKMENYSVKVLDTWHDVDTVEDLQELVTRNKNTEFSQSKSYKYAVKIVNSSEKKIISNS